MATRKTLTAGLACLMIATAAFLGGYLWWARSPVNAGNFARIHEDMSLREVGRLLGPISTQAESDVQSGRRHTFNDWRWFREQSWGQSYEFGLVSGYVSIDESGQTAPAQCYFWKASDMVIVVVFDREDRAVGASLCRRKA